MNYRKRKTTPEEQERIKRLSTEITDHLQNYRIQDAADLAEELEKIGDFTGWMLVANVYQIVITVVDDNSKAEEASDTSIETLILYPQKLLHLVERIREVVAEDEEEIKKLDYYNEIASQIESYKSVATESIYFHASDALAKYQRVGNNSVKQWSDLESAFLLVQDYKDAKTKAEECHNCIERINSVRNKSTSVQDKPALSGTNPNNKKRPEPIIPTWLIFVFIASIILFIIGESLK